MICKRWSMDRLSLARLRMFAKTKREKAMRLVGCVLIVVLSLWNCPMLVLGQSGVSTDPSVRTLQPGVKVTLLTEHPDLATPTGIATDKQGDVWLIACHTHFRPATYEGPEFDEVLVFDSQGKNRRVFYNRTKTTMQILLGSDGWVYLAQRDRILRVKDRDGDGRGDTEETVAVLETLADYPHNGLSGMAWHNDGGLIFSLGENFGKDWTLRGSDGRQLAGRGEGGVFHCSVEGKGLRRIAHGFWNPFGLWMRDDGILLAAENDPGSRPPCRLLHVVEGGDYGFQYVYGSAPVHPFVAWNGELRGTLGMIHPCGEGPCSVVELGGGVMVPSWSNHCIDYFPLKWSGATLVSEKIELLRGSDMFRPVAMVRADDRTFYYTDWVSPSYELHGMGRLWKMEIDPDAAPWIQREREPWTEQARLAEKLRRRAFDAANTPSLDELVGWIQGSDPFLADAAQSYLGDLAKGWTIEEFQALPRDQKLWVLVSLRKSSWNNPKWVQAVWSDRDPDIRFESLRWIADAVWREWQDEVEELLREPNLDYRLFEAAVATLNTLQGNPSAGVTDPKLIVAKVLDDAAPSRIRAYALRLAPPEHESLTPAVLRKLLSVPDDLLQTEVVRTLALKRTDEARRELASLLQREGFSDSIRLEAIAGLVGSVDAEQQSLLKTISETGTLPLQREARRVIRLSSPAVSEDATKRANDRSDVELWFSRLESMPGRGDPEAGRRIFFQSTGSSCAQCHRHDGRGNVVGPDLSLIARQGDSRSLLHSIVTPNRDVAPQFYCTLLELSDDTQFTGILLRSSSTEVYRNNFGQEVTFQKKDIVNRRELRTSLMPTGLLDPFTDEEVRDLLAFLTHDRSNR